MFIKEGWQIGESLFGTSEMRLLQRLCGDADITNTLLSNDLPRQGWSERVALASRESRRKFIYTIYRGGGHTGLLHPIFS